MKKVIVIGAGIGGLSISIFLQKAGFDVHLYEKNDKVGGLCSGYYVNGHYIDHCLHWLMGTNKDSKLYELWNEVGVLSNNVPIISLPTLGDFIYENQIVTFDRDLDKCEKEWLSISPIDKRAIKSFFATVRDVSSLMEYALKHPKYKKKKDLIGALPNSLKIFKAMKESREDYSKKFKHPAIRFALRNAQTGYNNMFFFFDLYGIFIKGNADVPSGGALYMSKRMEERFLSLGGHLYLNSNVENIITKDNVATGIKIGNKTEYGDIVISCLDPTFTLNRLLINKYRCVKVEKLNKNIANNPISSAYCLYVTIEGDISNISVPTCLHVKDLKVGSRKVESILIRPYGFDKEYFVKDNKTVVSIFIDQNQDDYHYFKLLSKYDYAKELNRIDKQIIEEIEKYFKNTKGKIEFLTHFSPIELNKHTNTSFGALQGFSFSSKSNFYILKPTIKGLSNLYLCSQWNRSIGGTPTAIESAKSISKEIIKKYL